MKPLEQTGWKVFLLAVVTALGACDLPTDTPKLDQEWIVPISGTSVDVTELLPPEVGLTTDESAFTVQVESIAFQETLEVLCEACQGLDGLTVPKPEFEGDFYETVSFPDEVESAQVEEGVIVVEAWNRFSFDPLRPPGGETGSFTLALRDGGPSGPILAEILVDGEDTSFGKGTRLSRELEYSGPVGSTLTVTVHVVSPAGGPEPGNWVLIRLDDEIEVTATPETVEAASAEISVAGEVFDLGIAQMNVGGLDQSVVDRIQSGSLLLDIVNPWSVGAVLNITVDGPTLAAPVVLIGSVPATPSSTVEVQLSRAELQSFLGEQNVILTGQGTANQEAGTVTLTPGQTMTLDAKLDLVLRIG